MRYCPPVIACLLTLLGCRESRMPGESPSDRTRSGHLDGVEAGAAEADAEIARGQLTLVCFGLAPRRTPDPATGLPVISKDGCVVHDYTLGVVDGHNSGIREYVMTRTSPSTTQATD